MEGKDVGFLPPPEVHARGLCASSCSSGVLGLLFTDV